jgi:putative transposase
MEFDLIDYVASPRGGYLKRLSEEYYVGDAVVHWTMTIDRRLTGWLDTVFHARFRELLTHSLSLYRIACPIYCLMPDHMHLMWMGLHPTSHQLNTMKHFRKRLNTLLSDNKVELQTQAYDHVLKDSERLEENFMAVCEYIARNPERAALVPIDGFASYPFSSCLVPGYPELHPFESNFWLRFARTKNYLRKQWDGNDNPFEMTDA